MIYVQSWLQQNLRNLIQHHPQLHQRVLHLAKPLRPQLITLHPLQAKGIDDRPIALNAKFLAILVVH